MVYVVIDRHFSSFLKGLKIFLNPRQSLIVPLTDFYHYKQKKLIRKDFRRLKKKKKGLIVNENLFNGYIQLNPNLPDP